MDTDDMSIRVASFSCYLDPSKDNLVRKISSQEKTNSPTIKPPPFSIKFSKSQDSLKNLRIDSFSYLNAEKDNNFVFEIPGPIEDPTSQFTFSQQIPKDGEIGIFGADKYFNMNLEYKTEPKTKYKNDVVNHIKPKTPSLCSEASSLNSQTALIPGFQRIGSTKHKKAIGRNFFTGFGCKGPCFDKKSVVQGSYFSSKPTSKSIDQDLKAKIESLDESRHSIEVFGSNDKSKGEIVTKMERKLSMLTWDAIPKGKTLPTSSSTITINCDDVASEASSDLFEIDNISGSIFPRRDDVSTCMSPTNSHYAPSEASIQWSVVTASAADYSVISEFNDETSVSVAGDLVSKGNRVGKAKTEGAQKGRAGLLGCKSHKAVDVAEKNVVCQKGNNEKVIGKSGKVKDVDSNLKLHKIIS